MWTPTNQYADKLRTWNRLIGLGLTERQIDELVLPDHIGPLQPTGISFTSGKGIEHDRKILRQIIEYELSKLGVSYVDYNQQDGRQVAYFPGSEPGGSDKPHLATALLDIGRFWDPKNGIVVRRVREQLKGQRLPGLEVDWLMALNPQVFAAIDYETVPGFVAPGLIVDSTDVPVFGRIVYQDREFVKAIVGGDWCGLAWDGHSVVVFR